MIKKPSPRRRQPSDMKVAVIGLGLRAEHLLTYLKQAMPELEVCGYHDPDPFGLEGIAKIMQRPTSFPDVAALLDTKPDLLFVTSPNHMHLEHIRAGLQAGVRIFAEKPIVISPEQTFELAQLLFDHGTDKVQVGLVLRYSLHMRDLQEALRDGLLGSIVSIEANEHIAPYHGAFFMRNWRRLSRYSGGFMLEKCCHDIDIYNMITGSRPVRVASFGGRDNFISEHAPGTDENTEVFHSKKSANWQSCDDPFTGDGDIVDNQVVICEYASGARLAFHTNTNVPDEQRRFCIMGTNGMAEGDFGLGYLKITCARTRKVLREFDYTSHVGGGVHYGADALMAKDLSAYLRGTATSLPVSVVDCMTAGLATMAMDKSREQGTIVDISPHWEKLDSFNLG